MTCREVVEFLMAYLADELPGTQRDVFEGHLALCPPCVNYLDSYQHTMRLSKAACHCPDGAAPADVPEELILAILDASRRN